MVRSVIKQMKRFVKTYGVFNGAILAIAVATLPTTCGWIVYQPDIPDGIRKLSLERDDSIYCEKNSR